MKTLRMGVKNAAFQQFEALKRNREKRTRQGLFFLEGVHPIERAVEMGWAFEAMAHADGVRLSGWAQDMIARAAPKRVYAAAPGLMAELSDRDAPCELIALVNRRADGLKRLSAAGKDALYVLVDRPQSPGNLGTIVRSADALGAAGLMTTGHSADFYDPQCIRASVGTVFALPFAAFDSVGDALSWLDGLAIRPMRVGTSARAEASMDQVDLRGPIALVIGNEATGLSRAWREACDVLARIPIGGAASSLNAGCAASICLYEIARQRRRNDGP